MPDRPETNSPSLWARVRWLVTVMVVLGTITAVGIGLQIANGSGLYVLFGVLVLGVAAVVVTFFASLVHRAMLSDDWPSAARQAREDLAARFDRLLRL